VIEIATVGMKACSVILTEAKVNIGRPKSISSDEGTS
jgi:hypothetical protein